MATLDSSIVNIALPTLSKDLNADLGGIKWVVILYLLMITAVLLPMGRLSDHFGRKRFYLMGFSVFTLGSGICALAPSLAGLVVARVVQGLGAAMLMANGPAVITASFPAHERGKGIGVLAMIVSAGLVSGPAIGGFFIHHFGWRSIFLVNIPIGILGIFLGNRFLPSDSPLDRSERWSFDWKGSVLQCILLSSVIFLVDIPRDDQGHQILNGAERVGGAVFLLFLLALFLREERKTNAPVLDLTLFRNRTFLLSSVSSFLTFVAYSCVAVLTPFFLETTLLLPTSRSGMLMSAIPVMIFFIAPVSGRLSDRWGSRGLSAFGAGLAAIGLFGLGGLFGTGGISMGMNSNIVGIWLVILGLALGIFQSPNNSALMGSVPHQKLGVASAIAATTRNLGMVLGTGLSTELFAHFQRRTLDFTDALRTTYSVAGCIAVGSVLVSLGKKRGPI